MLAGGFFYSWNRLASTGKKAGFFEYGNNCVKGDRNATPPTTDAFPGDCKNGGALRATTFVTGIGMGLAGGFAIYAVYKGFIAKKESLEPSGTVGKSTRKRSRFVVTPVIAPDGAGATVQLDW